jgi:uncharacterized membrane protein
MFTSAAVVVVYLIFVEFFLWSEIRMYCHDLGVTIDGIWIGEWIY